jgi:hypothetical protein
MTKVKAAGLSRLSACSHPEGGPHGNGYRQNAQAGMVFS